MFIVDLQSDEAAERQRILREKKTMFVSPFERYKRVMPMVAAQEEEDRKNQEKEEAERSRVAQQEEERTAKSIERVHEHFKIVAENVSGGNSNTPSESRVPKVQLPLSQMHGRKRKRQSDAMDSMDYGDVSKYDVSTPRPSRDVTVCQSYVKKCKNEIPISPRPQKGAKHNAATRISSPARAVQVRQNFGPKNKNMALPKTETDANQRQQQTTRIE